MENDRGLDDLFGALGDDEQPAPEHDSESTSATPTSASDASAALNAAFIEAATAPIEPIPTSDSAPAPEWSPPTGETLEPAPSESAPPADSVVAPPLTRRELRERQRAELGDDVEATAAGGAAAYYVGAQGETSYADGAEAEPDTAAPEAWVAPAAETAAPPLSTDDSSASVPESETVEAVAEPPAAEFELPAATPEPEQSVWSDEPFLVPSSEPEIADVGLAALATAPVVEPVPASAQPPAGPPSTPLGSNAPRQQAGRGFPIRLEPVTPPPRRRSVRWLAWFLPLVIVLGGIGAGGWWAWSNHEDKIREILGWEIPNDYTTTGNGVEVVITILPGQIGDDIAITLHDSGVTKSFDAFHDLLLEKSAAGEEPTFLPGNYRLQQEMSAQSALDALQDPANRITNQVIIPEGTNLPDTLAILAQQTGIPLEEFQAQAANYGQFGLPANAVSLEGYLFPASYDLDGTETATGLLQRLVTEMFTRLDALGVAPDDRNHFLTLASIVQKESGPSPEDPPKIARVFLNRIDAGMMLESDATVTYGTCVWGPTQGRTPPDTCGTVWLNQADIDDTSNPYNTRSLPGLPPGPIAMPGQASLEAVAAPADGPWLFFVAVNLATGETVFSETIEAHDAAVDQLYAWCEASDENASYCA
jgi:UPF0755 protein